MEVKDRLRVQCTGREKDHSCHEYQYRQGAKLSKVLEQVPGEERISRNGKIIHKGADEYQKTQDQWNQSSGGVPWILIATRVESEEEDGDSNGEEKCANEVQLLEFLPLGFTIWSGMARREVHKECSYETKPAIADGYPKHDPPCGVGNHDIG